MMAPMGRRGHHRASSIEQLRSKRAVLKAATRVPREARRWQDACAKMATSDEDADNADDDDAEDEDSYEDVETAEDDGYAHAEYDEGDDDVEDDDEDADEAHEANAADNDNTQPR